MNVGRPRVVIKNVALTRFFLFSSSHLLVIILSNHIIQPAVMFSCLFLKKYVKQRTIAVTFFILYMHMNKDRYV